MKIEVIVTRSDAVIRRSNRTGNNFAQQAVGVLFPGEDFPMADQMLVDIDERSGEARPVAPGRYTAEASVSKSGYNFELAVNYRSLQPLQVKPTGVAPAPQKAA